MMRVPRSVPRSSSSSRDERASCTKRWTEMPRPRLAKIAMMRSQDQTETKTPYSVPPIQRASSTWVT